MEEVDVTGAVCPRPVLIVRRCLEELGPGEELRVTGDYPPAERNLKRTCYKHGYEVTTDDTDDETFALRIRVTDDARLEPEQ